MPRKVEAALEPIDFENLALLHELPGKMMVSHSRLAWEDLEAAGRVRLVASGSDESGPTWNVYAIGNRPYTKRKKEAS